MINFNNDISEDYEQFPLQRFRQEVSEHSVCGAIDDGDIFSIHVIFNPKEPNIDVPRFSSCRSSPILLQKYRNLIVLKDYVPLNAISL